MSDNKPIVLGYVAGAHGLGGEVRIKLFHAESAALKRGVTVVLSRDGASRSLEVARIARQGDTARVGFEGIDGREAAEALVRSEVSVDRSTLPALADDEVYLSDLVGLKATDGGADAGVIEAVIHHPASDCVRIRDAEGVREVPLREPYLLEIDLREGCVRFALLEDFPRET